MASFEIILGHTPDASRPPPALGAALELLDVVIDGERFSAAAQPEHAAYLLRDLVTAATSLLEGKSPKALVPLCDAPWELCLVRGSSARDRDRDTAPGAVVLAVSLYRTGPLPEVRLLDRPVAPGDLAVQTRAALGSMAKHLAPSFARELGGLVDRLDAAVAHPVAVPPPPPDTLVQWRSRDPGAPVRAAFEAVVPGAGASVGAAVRADLHALLFRGRLALDVRGQPTDFGTGYVFLQLERVVSLCRPLIEAYTARRALHLRVAAGGATLGLRLDTDGRLALSVTRPNAPTLTAAGLDPRDLARLLADAALALAQGLVRCDRTRARNLRLRALRAEARGVRRMINALGRAQSKLNDDPGPYRASTVETAPRTARAPAGFDLASATRLRYVQRWRAEIEGIDLAGTLLCGDRLVVSGTRETCALDRRSGAVVWSRPLPRAATTLAGDDILRLSSRGDAELRDVHTGDVLWATRVAPRVGTAPLAFTVSTGALPHAVLLAEGERRLVALDLRTGEPRWRYTSRQGGAFRIRRVGRLLIVAAGDPSLVALDAMTGEVVWRFVGPSPFALTPALHRDVVLAVTSASPRGAARLFAVDAFTGALRWTREFTAPAAGVPVGAADVAALPVTERAGMFLLGHDLATGAERFRVALGAAAPQNPTLALRAFDDLFVANLPTGRVTAVDAVAGAARWSRVLCPPVADDTPRRLDVQLRAGALFVPQSSLAVLRPRDGMSIANVEACDLVPDLLRIDEECAMYVGEESGHVGCYELGARLTLLRALN